MVVFAVFGHFFFKQKTAYEIMPSLVGSEMCIRDRIIYYVKKSNFNTYFTLLFEISTFKPGNEPFSENRK